jgi:hypothetical protein
MMLLGFAGLGCAFRAAVIANSDRRGWVGFDDIKNAIFLASGRMVWRTSRDLPTKSSSTGWLA